MSEIDERATLVHALREEPGACVGALQEGSELNYTVRPSDGRFVAEWEYVADSGVELARSKREEFSSYVDALVQIRSYKPS